MNFSQELLYNIHITLLSLVTAGGIFGAILILKWLIRAILRQ